MTEALVIAVLLLALLVALITFGLRIFNNVALTEDGDIWWEGLENTPEHATSWKGTTGPRAG